MNNPFDFVDVWDFLILVFGMLLRMFYSLNQKVRELGKETFSFQKYFDAKHVIRWTGHVVASVGFILVAPQFILLFGKTVFGVSLWNGASSFITGFFGYDLIKLFEKVGQKIGIKIGDGQKMESGENENKTENK